ncbi:hypothetical protein Q3G72_020086 [Acer saccharum]|nr:hypothetical protein Q3G72_020086 [Acer saccharum]
MSTPRSSSTVSSLSAQRKTGLCKIWLLPLTQEFVNFLTSLASNKKKDHVSIDVSRFFVSHWIVEFVSWYLTKGLMMYLL